ncbi:MAG TPA: type II secretion system F family protein, partial [bacterium]|nr:type II secretion system F family protein [bacterium]
ASVLEKDYAMKKGIKAAMLYPKIVVFVLCSAISALMILVVPKFKTMYDSLNTELPLPTKIMIGTSNFFVDYGWMLLIAVIFLFVAYNKFYKTAKGKYLIDRFTFKPPIFGPLALKVANARFSNILACLYKSGLPVTKALSITAETIGNEAFMREVRMLQADVEKGHGIADSMRKLTFFAPIIIEATNIGEKTGSLDTMLISMGEHYDIEISHTTKNLSTMLEPILLVMIFGIVTVFALAIFLPMWGMHSAMLGKGG